MYIAHPLLALSGLMVGYLIELLQSTLRMRVQSTVRLLGMVEDLDPVILKES